MKLLVSDYDGTLKPDIKNLMINIEAINEFRKKGNLEIMLSIFQRSDKIKFRKRKQYGQRRSLL